jgi:hypothetical protein
LIGVSNLRRQPIPARSQNSSRANRAMGRRGLCRWRRNLSPAESKMTKAATGERMKKDLTREQYLDLYDYMR